MTRRRGGGRNGESWGENFNFRNQKKSQDRRPGTLKTHPGGQLGQAVRQESQEKLKIWAANFASREERSETQSTRGEEGSQADKLWVMNRGKKRIWKGTKKRSTLAIFRKRVPEERRDKTSSQRRQ